jgi:hypothetical protein
MIVQVAEGLVVLTAQQGHQLLLFICGVGAQKVGSVKRGAFRYRLHIRKGAGLRFSGHQVLVGGGIHEGFHIAGVA